VWFIKKGATPIVWYQYTLAYEKRSPHGLRSAKYQLLRMIRTHRLFSIRERNHKDYDEVSFQGHKFQDIHMRYKGSDKYEIAYL